MKPTKISLLIVLILSGMIAFYQSCKKADVPFPTNPTESAFAENDVVLYWNAKASTVLTGPFTPPAQSRYFAMIQIAVHDALNSIKPKYQPV